MAASTPDGLGRVASWVAAVVLLAAPVLLCRAEDLAQEAGDSPAPAAAPRRPATRPRRRGRGGPPMPETGGQTEESEPVYLPDLSLLTVGNVARPVHAVLTPKEPILRRVVDVTPSRYLTEVSFYSDPATAGPEPVRWQVAFEPQGQAAAELAAGTVAPGKPEWTTVVADLMPYRGVQGQLIVSAAAPPGNGYDVLVSAGSLYGRRAPGELNLLMICLDTLRADHLGCYGYERDTSPFMDSFAERGVRWARCNSQAPWTAPSLFSAFTGQYPDCHWDGAWGRPQNFNPNAPTLAAALRDQGYRTAALTGGGVASPGGGLATGFDSFEAATDGGKIPGRMARALSWLEEYGEDRFFLLLHTYEVHDPYLREFFTDGGSTTKDSTIRSYDSCIRFADMHIEQLIDCLSEEGILDDTLVVIFSDHGEDFRDIVMTPAGPKGQHGHCLLQTVLHVPVIIVGPGVAEGTVIEERVELMDLFPTVLELLGIEPPGDLHGRSLADAVRRGAPVQPGFLYSEGIERGPARRAVVEGDWKLILGEEGEWAGRGRVPWYYELETQRLYDLAADPSETRNLLKRRPEVARRLEARLDEVRARIEPVRAANEKHFLTRDDREEQVLKQLRALGYVQ